MKVAVTIDDRATEVLRRLVGNAAGARQKLVRNLAESLEEHVKAQAPVGRHYDLQGNAHAPGYLRQSLHFALGETGAVLMGAAYGRIVITGAGPHPIVVRNAKNLRFYWAKRGKVFVGPAVNHPGSPPNDFRRRALKVANDDGTIERAATRFWQDLGEEG